MISHDQNLFAYLGQELPCEFHDCAFVEWASALFDAAKHDVPEDLRLTRVACELDRLGPVQPSWSSALARFIEITATSNQEVTRHE